jgi:ribosomal protein L3
MIKLGNVIKNEYYDESKIEYLMELGDDAFSLLNNGHKIHIPRGLCINASGKIIKNPNYTPIIEDKEENTMHPNEIKRKQNEKLTKKGIKDIQKFHKLVDELPDVEEYEVLLEALKKKFSTKTIKGDFLGQSHFIEVICTYKGYSANGRVTKIDFRMGDDVIEKIISEELEGFEHSDALTQVALKLLLKSLKLTPIEIGGCDGKVGVWF